MPDTSRNAGDSLASSIPTMPLESFSSATVPTEYIEAKGIRYAYRRLGRGTAPPLLFLQHFRGMMDDWDPSVVDGLAQRGPVVLFDNAGIGLSSGSVPGSVAEMARDAVAFVEALGLAQIDLMAFSLGGFVGQQILLEYPKLVRRAIFAGTGPQGGDGMQGYTPEVTSEAVRFPLTGREKEFLFFAPSRTSQEAGAAFIARTQLRALERDVPTTVQAMESQGTAIAAWGLGSRDTYEVRLSAVTQPTLVVSGSKDVMVPSINAYALSQCLSNAQLIMYPDAGHGAIFQHARLFVAHAALFLA